MTQTKRFKLPPAALIAISVFSVIAVGTALLCIPAASNSGQVDFLAAFFTATSATCVTGLSAVDTASHWSYFGQAIILVLMQIGGLGLITILSVFFLYMQKRVSLSQRKLVMQSAGFVSLDGIKKLVKYIMIVTFACEFVGSFLMCFSFVPVMGWGRGIWQSVFTGVSAFCNCGYTLTGWYGQDSLNAYISDLCDLIEKKSKLGVPAAAEEELVKKLSAANEAMYFKANEIDKLLIEAKESANAEAAAKFFAEKVIPVMQELRAYADEMELSTAKKYWPFPTYGEILFSV